MDNPFETGHIKNYMLLYVSVVVIMILIFIATTLFHDVQKVEKKSFDTNTSKTTHTKKPIKNSEERNTTKFKLLQKAYTNPH